MLPRLGVGHPLAQGGLRLAPAPKARSRDWRVSRRLRSKARKTMLYRSPACVS